MRYNPVPTDQRLTMENQRNDSEEGDGIDLSALESETLSILDKYGSGGKKLSKRVQQQLKVSSDSGGISRPWTGASTLLRSRRVFRSRGSGGGATFRPFTSVGKKAGQRQNAEPEGRADVAPPLRETISSALSTTEFDSVPSLLASNKALEKSPYMPASGGVLPRSPVKSRAKKPADDQAQLERVGPFPEIDSLALRDIPYSGFDKIRNKSAPSSAEAKKLVCFVCWSADQAGTCVISSSTAANQSLSMCSNWDTGLLRRMYRSEDIMEGGSSRPGGATRPSLVFDKATRSFTTREQPVHPIYRLVEEHVERLNFTSQRKQKVSFVVQEPDNCRHCRYVPHSRINVLIVFPRLGGGSGRSSASSRKARFRGSGAMRPRGSCS